MIRARFSIAAVGMACLLAAGACGSDDDDDGASEVTPSDSAASTGADTVAETDGEPADVATTLRGRFLTEPTLFDPIFVSNFADLATAQIVYEGLIAPSPDGEGVVNVLADTWEVSDDGLTVDFTLKEGVQFHDGYGEVTTDDVKFSLERAAGIIPSTQESGAYAFYTALERVDVIDKYSGTIVIKEPSVPLMEQALPLTAIISKAAFEELGEEEFAQHPVGTGPYEFDEWVPGEYVRFTNFAEYSGQAPFVPQQRFDELVFQIITEDSAAELAYEAGDLDFLAIRAASVPRFEGLDDTSVTSSTTMIYRFIGMNVLDPALANENLREAIIAAIDVPSIIEATSEGQDTRALALVGPTAPIGYWADAPVHDQDLDEARRLVQLVPEEQRTLKMTIADDETSRTVAQIAQQNLQDAGVTLEIEILDAASFFVTGEGNRQRQLFYTEYGINYREPTQELVWFTCGEIDGWNYMYWCDEEFSELYEQAQTELDPDARNEIYIEMQRLFDEAASTVWVSHPTAFIAARADTVEVVMDPTGTVILPALRPQ